MSKFKFGKLVRDNLPYTPYFRGIRILEPADFIEHLKKKLVEEVEELSECTTSQALMEEIADIYEILEELIKASEFNPDDIDALQQQKKFNRGGFKKRLFVDHIEVEQDSELEKYYLDRPKKYPKLVK